MANNVPQLSYQAILGQMLSTLFGETGLNSVQLGNPLLTLLEITATSDFRNSQNSFNLLSSISLDYATGSALDYLGALVNLPRGKATFATTVLNFTDTSFTKVSTVIYPGIIGPPANSTVINVVSKTGFPATGSIYIGRGTTNVEGPLAYTSISSVSGYYAINLSTPTKYFHNINESVVLAQGGIRNINAGTLVQIPPTLNNQTITYKTLYSASIPDGEVLAAGVQAVCQIAGSVGNTPFNTITQITSSIFNGATVTNPNTVTNGLDSQNDTDYRQSIRLARQNQSKGTDSAIINGVVGITSPTENKTIISANINPNGDGSDTLFIDDGTGYEEIDFGIGFESIVPKALGGEKLFKLASQPPVSKAKVFTVLTSPFNISPESVLSATVGGITTSHTFQVQSFNSIASATSYEVVDSINSDPNLNWSARTYNSATQVAIFPRANVDSSIQVVSSGVNDANIALGFPTNLFNTLNLYKNNILLHENGLEAIIYSNPITKWTGAIGATGSETLTIAVDNTPAVTYTFTANDFVNQNTGYFLLGINSIAAWVKVFNSRIPGITAAQSGSSITFTSNSGFSANASIAIASSSSLVINGMFNPLDLSASGQNDDYTFNRNTGEITLNTQLATNDVLAAGSFNTQGYINSALISNPNSIVISSTPYWWISVDGAAENISIPSLGATVSLSLPYAAGITTIATPVIARLTSVANTFNNLQIGDWVMVWDTGLVNSTFNPFSASTGMPGMVRVTNLDVASYSWFEFETPFHSGSAPYTATLSNNGIAFARTNSKIQQITVSSGTYTLDTLALAINAVLVGANAVNYNNTFLQLATNNPTSNGDVAFLASNTAGSALGFPIQLALSSAPSLPYVKSATLNLNTPSFTIDQATSVISSNFVAYSPIVGSDVNWLKSFPNVVLKVNTIAFTSVSTFTFSTTVPSNVVPGMWMFLGNRSYSNTIGPILTVSGSTVTVSGDYSSVTTPAVANIFSFRAEINAPSTTTSSTGLSNNGFTTTVTLTNPSYTQNYFLAGSYVKIVGAQNPAYNGTFGPITIASNTTSATQITYAQVVSGGLPNSGYGNILPVILPDYSTNTGNAVQIATDSSNTLTLRTDNTEIPAVSGDRFYYSSPYAISSNDTLDVFLNNNENTNFAINLFRDIVPSIGSSYSQTITVLDADNSNAQLSTAFGTSFSFADYMLYQNGKAKSHDSTQVDQLGMYPGTADTTSYTGKGVIWRYAKQGPDAEGVLFKYVYPNTANFTTPTLSMVNTVNKGLIANSLTEPFVALTLPSGPARTGIGLNNNYWLMLTSQHQTSVSFTSFTTGSGNTIFTVNNYLPVSVGEVLLVSDSVPHSGNFKVVSTSYSSTYTITVSGTWTGSSTGTIQTANSYLYSTAGSPQGLFSGLDFPAASLSTPSYSIHTIVGNGTAVTVNISTPAGATAHTAAGSGFTAGYYNPPPTGAGTSGNLLVASYSPSITNMNSIISISGTGTAVDGGTYTVASLTVTGGNIQITFASAASFSTVTGTGAAKFNTVTAKPTLPSGTFIDLTKTGLSASSLNHPELTPIMLKINAATGASVDANYSSNYFAYCYVANNSISYIDANVAVPASASSSQNYVGLLTPYVFPNSGTLANTQFQFSGNVSAYDVVNISAANQNNLGGFPGYLTGSWCVNLIGNQWFTFVSDAGELAPPTSFHVGRDLYNFTNNPVSFFPIEIGSSAPTVSQLLTAVNTAAYANIASGVAVTDPNGGTPGAGTIQLSTDAEFFLGTSNAYNTFFTGISGSVGTSSVNYNGYVFNDGHNFVSSSTLTGLSSTLVLKNPISSILSNYNDYASDKMKLVPITNYSIVNFLNSPAVTGISNYANVNTTDDGFGIQMSSLDPGSFGSIQIAGGTGNSKVTPIVSANVQSLYNYTVATVAASDALVLSGNQWVSIQSETPIPKLIAKNTGSNNPVINSLSFTPTATNLRTPDAVDIGVVEFVTGATPNFKIQFNASSGQFSISIGGLSGNTWSNIPSVNDVLVIPTGSVIASTSNAGAYIINLATPSTLYVTPISGQNPVSVPFSNFSATPSNDIYVTTSNAVTGAVYLNISNINALSLSSDGTDYSRILGNIEWQVEKHGHFMAYSGTIRGGFAETPAGTPFMPYSQDSNSFNNGEGGWVNVNVQGMSPQNQGVFQVVRTTGGYTDQNFNTTTGTFWVYNPNGVEEVAYQIDASDRTVTEADSYVYFKTQQDFVDFYNFDSVLPGDTITLNFNDTLGLPWSGSYTVAKYIPPPATFSSSGGTMTGTTTGSELVLLPKGTLIPSKTGLTSYTPAPNSIIVNSVRPSVLYKQISYITPNTLNPTTFSDIYLNSPNLGDRINPVYSFTMTALDKLGFPETTIQGLDAYKVATGLIAEANKVVYGVPNNTIAYPGIAAAQADVNIEAAIVKSITISVAVRLAVTNSQQVEDNIKSAIASVVNNSKVGQSISLSLILSAAQSVEGVISAVLLSPSLTSSNDEIIVQAFEKALVSNVDADITVTQL